MTEEQWQLFKEVHVDAARITVGMRRPKKAKGLQSNTWRLVGERKEFKKRIQQEQDNSKKVVL